LKKFTINIFHIYTVAYLSHSCAKKEKLYSGIGGAEAAVYLVTCHVMINDVIEVKWPLFLGWYRQCGRPSCRWWITVDC